MSLFSFHISLSVVKVYFNLTYIRSKENQVMETLLYWQTSRFSLCQQHPDSFNVIASEKSYSNKQDNRMIIFIWVHSNSHSYHIKSIIRCGHLGLKNLPYGLLIISPECENFWQYMTSPNKPSIMLWSKKLYLVPQPLSHNCFRTAHARQLWFWLIIAWLRAAPWLCSLSNYQEWTFLDRKKKKQTLGFLILSIKWLFVLAMTLFLPVPHTSIPSVLN